MATCFTRQLSKPFAAIVNWLRNLQGCRFCWTSRSQRNVTAGWVYMRKINLIRIMDLLVILLTSRDCMVICEYIRKCLKIYNRNWVCMKRCGLFFSIPRVYTVFRIEAQTCAWAARIVGSCKTQTSDSKNKQIKFGVIGNIRPNKQTLSWRIIL